jgi:hypothetical protein
MLNNDLKKSQTKKTNIQMMKLKNKSYNKNTKVPKKGLDEWV